MNNGLADSSLEVLDFPGVLTRNNCYKSKRIAVDDKKCRNKPAIISKIQVVAGDLPVTLSPSDSMVKGSDTFDTVSASPDAHDTSSPVVHAISLQSGLKAIPRMINKMCFQGKVIARYLSRKETALSTRGGGKFCNISVISVYAPTLSADDRDKDTFYAELQLLTKSLPKRNMIIIGGGWNARVGNNAAAMTSTIGKYGIEDRCANRERYGEEHELFVTSAYFRHHRKHLVTWNSQDNQHFN
ncbi:unnamed protein product [Dracunculus medinensis]|uniref:Craniofacial development protein 2-like n=1 Tax=Dracunculus medinensis TaxID=318479 RepID=A0A0N4U5I8_DRAME|nr:unnamed protein product [Dracunculus medinensis]